MGFPETASDLDAEMWFIRKGGKHLAPDGKTLVGLDLWLHYRNAQSILWPEDDHHRWSDLALRTIIENEISVFIGPGDSNKTYSMIRYALVDFWAFPHSTLFIISSTEGRGLEIRIWGWMKTLLNRAKEFFPDLDGYVIESMKAITPESVHNENKLGRSFTKGMICVPCLSGGRWVGLGKFVGVKQKRLRHLGDEVSHMQMSFLQAYSNWYGKPDFKGVMAGNPLDPMDPLGRAGEPQEGWTGMVPPTKTAQWRSKWFNAAVVNFVGSDSPNFDPPLDRYPYLLGPKKLRTVAATYGRDSMEWCSQCEGVMLPGLVGKRVITRELCRQHGAHDKAIWGGTARTKVYACDPAYGGGDRCIGGWGEFGEDIDGRPILCLHPPEIIPVSIKAKKIPEDQIAEWIKARLTELAIPVENSFWDSFGKGTLGFAFAKIFGASTPNPVDSGMRPTKRPVGLNEMIEENGQKRLKRCDEHYSKFVTEMWFSVRYVIIGDQMRELPVDVMEEGCLREYKTVLGNKYEVEPKEDTKERMGRSPDLMDWCAVLVEGARRLGFQIQRLGGEKEVGPNDDWYVKRAEEWRGILKGKMLVHS